MQIYPNYINRTNQQKYWSSYQLCRLYKNGKVYLRHYAKYPYNENMKESIIYS